MKINSEDNTFSIGQRQLLCIARVILEDNKIIILDEATANIDPKYLKWNLLHFLTLIAFVCRTDLLIQETIDKEFANCTIISIAHRIQSVARFNKILVLENGTVVEYDHPYVLLMNENGYFYRLLKEMGSDALRELQEVFKKTYG